MLRKGTSLIELSIALCILGVLLSIAIPALRKSMDSYAAQAGRDTILALAARARAVAIACGGAELVIDAQKGSAWIEAEGVSESIAIGERFNVRITIENSSRTIARIRYDAIGLGRLANLTVSVERRGAVARVVFSMYGRARRA